MKKIYVVLLFALLTLCLPLVSLAYEDSDAESIADSVGADELTNEYLTEDEIAGDARISIFEKAYAIIVDALKSQGLPVVRAFGGLLAVITLCCVMGSLKLGESDALDTAVAYISVLALAGAAYSVLYNLFITVIAAMESITLVMGTLMPVMTSLYVYGGNAAASAASSSALAMLLTVISILCTKLILPMLRVSFSLCLAGAMPGSVNLSSVTSLVKSTATTVMAFIFTMLGFVLYFQTVIAASGDGFVMRSVRFASGVFLPVIGSMLGDAARTVAASVSIVKGTVGGVGVVMILAVILPPVISALLHKLMLLGCAIIAKTLSCERESAFLYDLCGVISVLLALLVGTGVVCIIAMAVFLRIGGA